MAFDIMEAVRKGKVAKGGFQPGWEEAMREHEVPDWYIESCRKIKYMFPKAACCGLPDECHPADVVQDLAKPQAFYAVYFTVRGDDIDYEAAIGGAAVARAHMEAVKRRLKEEKERQGRGRAGQLAAGQRDAEPRGYEFLPIELGKSRGSKYMVEDGKVRLPFSALKGLGRCRRRCAGAGDHPRRGISLHRRTAAGFRCRSGHPGPPASGGRSGRPAGEQPGELSEKQNNFLSGLTILKTRLCIFTDKTSGAEEVFFHQKEAAARTMRVFVFCDKSNQGGEITHADHIVVNGLAAADVADFHMVGALGLDDLGQILGILIGDVTAGDDGDEAGILLHMLRARR